MVSGKLNYFLCVLIILSMLSCRATRDYNPNRKYAPAALKEDYTLLRNILEEKHPTLYWYTSQDSMDYYFDRGYRSIKDSMTELMFGWKVLAPLVANIHCGHTSFSMSKGWDRFIEDKSIPSFPLRVKVWGDSLLVLRNMNQDSPIVKKGSFITAINGIPAADMVSHIMQYMVEDGYSRNFDYIRLSNSFPYFHRNIYGLYQQYLVDYTDSTGHAYSAKIPWHKPKIDTSQKKKGQIKRPRWSRIERLGFYRQLKLDSGYALMTLNAFTKGNLNSFFRKSFRKLQKDHTPNLIIDLRINGGGDINKTVLLTKYLRDAPFKVADSVYSVAKNFAPYSRYITHSFFNNIGLLFLTHRKRAREYHFGYWERHVFEPRKRHHFDGKIYILTDGYTFSAASLFCSLMKGQKNVELVGQETGGGWYGNSGVMIPDIVLPHTKLRIRLPFFKLVQYHHVAFKGTGVEPDWYIGPNWRDLLKGKDTKLRAVIDHIKKGE